MQNQIVSNPDNLYGFRIKMYPTDEQKARIKEMSDLFRFFYNKSVAIQICSYYNITEEEYFKLKRKGFTDIDINFMYKDKEKGKRPSFVDMCKILGKFRNENAWSQKLPVGSVRYAIRNVLNGYRRFFESKTTNKHPPRMKKKDNLITFSLRGERVYFKDKKVKIEGIQTMIDVKSVEIPQNEPFYSCTVTCNNDDEYWLSFQTEMHRPIIFYPREGPIGVDVGLRKLVTLSDGTVYKPLDTRRLEKRRRLYEKRVAKDRKLRQKRSREAKTKLGNIPMSKRMQKRYLKFRKLTTHIWNKRNTYVHQITREIINRRPSAIVIEDLDVEGLKHDYCRKHKHIDLREYLFSTIHKQLEYKARWEGITVIKAGKYYPSSQICSRCGARQKIGLNERYVCPECGLSIDRDINAALNLRGLAT